MKLEEQEIEEFIKGVALVKFQTLSERITTNTNAEDAKANIDLLEKMRTLHNDQYLPDYKLQSTAMGAATGVTANSIFHLAKNGLTNWAGFFNTSAYVGGLAGMIGYIGADLYQKLRDQENPKPVRASQGLEALLKTANARHTQLTARLAGEKPRERENVLHHHRRNASR